MPADLVLPLLREQAELVINVTFKRCHSSGARVVTLGVHSPLAPHRLCVRRCCATMFCMSQIYQMGDIGGEEEATSVWLTVQAHAQPQFRKLNTVAGQCRG